LTRIIMRLGAGGVKIDITVLSTEHLSLPLIHGRN
jgi:hypothetical protein